MAKIVCLDCRRASPDASCHLIPPAGREAAQPDCREPDRATEPDRGNVRELTVGRVGADRKTGCATADRCQGPGFRLGASGPYCKREEKAAADHHRSLSSLIEKVLADWLRKRDYPPAAKAAGGPGSSLKRGRAARPAAYIGFSVIPKQRDQGQALKTLYRIASKMAAKMDKKITIRVPDYVHKDLRRLAVDQSTTVQALVFRAIVEMLEASRR
jgi:hypothetical protein